ncbi:hypothetical protein [Sandarakinorhabdus cyanobacteriorum]|uniref:hypothetical protein n=1 Tax=Sandarakinorhabdus cyanobacteriorum TaxID=1981098 RepID=UPI0013FD28B5|nr:hypothetical protein [Sandarakinorhabdus cyanobacteriorum]
MKPLNILSILLMLASIGLLIFGIVNDKSMVAVAMPLLVVGIAVGAQARKREGK